VRIRRFLHILLQIGVIVLLWQIIATWRRPLPELIAAAPDPAAGGAMAQPSPLRTPGDGKQLAEVIADKDLFSPSRSRAAGPVEIATPVATPPPSHLKLVGVFLSPNREEAFFVDSSQGGKVVRVRKGESLGAYRLNKVSPLRVTLTVGQDGEEVALPLVLLDSGGAGRAPRLLPTAQRARGEQARQAAAGQVPTPPGIPDESGIRQDILRLQQRLRQIRQKAARERTDSENNGDDENGSGEEEEESEE
jgi:hypothetical protein